MLEMVRVEEHVLLEQPSASDIELTVSTTDPESGIFHIEEHERCFAYEAHAICDRHNFVLDTVVTSSGNSDLFRV